MQIDEKADAWLEDERTSTLYQVIGSLAEAAGVFDDPHVIRALDLAAYGKTQDGGDVLPFCPAYESAKQKGEAEGWVLVPKEPTEPMIEAHFHAHATAMTVFADVPDVWRAMLAAAPEPPTMRGRMIDFCRNSS